MSETSIHQMKIFELRNKLKEVGLLSSGTKAELISRLSQYYEEQSKQEAVKEDKPIEEAESSTIVTNIQEQETVIQEEAVSKEEITDLEIQETTQIEQLPTELSTVVTLPEEEPEVKEPTSANTSIPTEIISDSTVDMSQSILEARCKRFGIPFNPTKQPVETKKQKKQQKKQNLHTNEYQKKLEERRKRFGAIEKTVEMKEKKQMKPERRHPAYVQLSEEEKEKLQARRRRFGIM